MLVAERYRLEQPLGRGGMGEVWTARDELLGRTVAVKLLAVDADDTATRRFRREAEIAARLNHPHVVALYDAGAHEGRLFLAMEFVHGGSLAQQLAVHGVLPPERVAGLAAQIAAGLSAAHQQGVIHRDVKPGNLLLSAEGTVKIADFGIARSVHDTTTALTTTGQLLGTSAYLAPERALGRPAGPASDVYALGCVLYELLVGHAPFRGANAAAVVHQHVSAVPVRPGQLRRGLPHDTDDYLLRLLAKEPGHRPTAERVADWFTTAQDRRHPAPSPPPPPATPAPAARHAAPAAPTPRGPQATAAARWRTPVVLGVCGAVLFGTSVLVGTTLTNEARGPSGSTRPAAPTTPTPLHASTPRPTTTPRASMPRPAATPSPTPAAASPAPSLSPQHKPGKRKPKR
ncbi:serine/threonine protein kinase [Streptomyces sp. TRM68367]|nr:serine/threonine protein kinase [Streptomyces sp. TRM68367]